MTALILFFIWLSWELLTLIAKHTGTDAAVFAAPFAGLTCALFGVLYF